jgi:hypothetical protein
LQIIAFIVIIRRHSDRKRALAQPAFQLVEKVGKIRGRIRLLSTPQNRCRPRTKKFPRFCCLYGQSVCDFKRNSVRQIASAIAARFSGSNILTP